MVKQEIIKEKNGIVKDRKIRICLKKILDWLATPIPKNGKVANPDDFFEPMSRTASHG